METNNKTNSIENLFKKTLGEFTIDELHLIFYNLYRFPIYIENNNYFIMYSEDNCKQLDKNHSLFRCIKKAKVIYEHNLELYNKRKIITDFKKIFEL